MVSSTKLALALQNNMRLDDKTLLSLLKSYSRLQSELSNSELAEYVRDETAGKRQLTSDDLAFAETAIESSQKVGIEIFVWGSRAYPAVLNALKQPPPLLHLRGNKRILESVPGVAIVGTRDASDNGKIIAERIAHHLASAGWVGVSGLALGIDAAAHSGAIAAAQNSTIAVLASGLDKASPKANEELAARILESGGAWVSEHAIGVPAKRHHFVPRNRIQVGLSSGSIIVEAEQKSGSISQANFCRQINRPLFVVVPRDSKNILGLRSAGTELLHVERNAIPLTSKNDYPDLISTLSTSKKNLVTRWSR